MLLYKITDERKAGLLPPLLAGLLSHVSSTGSLILNVTSDCEIPQYFFTDMLYRSHN